MTLAINRPSMADLKALALKLNAKIEGDRRLRATWENAIALAQSALKNAATSIDEFTGYPLTKSITTVAKASVEAYAIAHAQFVVPTENAIAFTYNALTSEQAFARYLKAAISLMRLCFALYKSGMIAREWCEALVEECLESDEELQLLPILEARAIESVKFHFGRCVNKMWAMDAKYQDAIALLVARVKMETRSVFSIGEWVALMVK